MNEEHIQDSIKRIISTNGQSIEWLKRAMAFYDRPAFRSLTFMKDVVFATDSYRLHVAYISTQLPSSISCTEYPTEHEPNKPVCEHDPQLEIDISKIEDGLGEIIAITSNMPEIHNAENIRPTTIASINGVVAVNLNFLQDALTMPRENDELVLTLCKNGIIVRGHSHVAYIAQIKNPRYINVRFTI